MTSISTTGLHVLHVRADPGMAGGLRYTVSCPHDPADLSRDCVAWWPCIEHDELSVDLDERGEGPCDEAEPATDGRHREINDELFHPTRGCYLAIADRLLEEAEDLGRTVGDYRVHWIPEEDGALNLAVVDVDVDVDVDVEAAGAVGSPS